MERLASEVKEVFYIGSVTLPHFTFEFGPIGLQINDQFLSSTHPICGFFIFSLTCYYNNPRLHAY